MVKEDKLTPASIFKISSDLWPPRLRGRTPS